ncbi:BTAD domain-containing putative transcriptional regulator [Flindersiella endophytica]
MHVHRLRQVLGPERILHEAAGYRLVVHAGELDSVRFTDLVGQAHAARRALDLAAAHGLLESALELWRGEPYPDAEEVEPVADEVRRLTDQRLLALEDLAGLRLDLKRHSEVLPELQQLVRANPYRERLRALLLLALYRCGRRTEALEEFRATRSLLRNELGLEPGATLQRLHEAVLRGDAQLTDVLSSSLDGTWEPVPAQAAATQARQAPAQPGVPRQLPFVTAGFTGRRRERKELDELLGTGEPGDRPAGMPLAVLTGTAGVGKTTLAVRWSHSVADRFPDGQLYVNLRGFDPAGEVMSPAEAVRGFLEAFAIPPDRIPASMEGQLALYRSTLAGKRALVLLDNARDVAHARPLLPGSQSCLTLVTSRDPLSGLVAAEGARSIVLDLLSPEDGRELLAQRLGSERTGTEAQAVDEIVQRCARLPLALAVVAARAVAHPSHPLEAIARELAHTEEHLSALSTGEATTDVRSVFSWSYRTLSPAAARLFRLLGLHPGPDASAAAAASLAAVPPRVAGELLAELARARLITEPEPGRYAFHDLLRAYAAELANSEDTDRDTALYRLFDHYVRGANLAYKLIDPRDLEFEPMPPRAGAVRLEIPDLEQAQAWFDAEWPVLAATVQAAHAAGFDSHAWHLGRLVAPYLDLSGRWQAWVSLQNTALEAARRLGDRSAQSLAHRTLGRVYSRIGRREEALDHLSEGLAVSTELGHETDQAMIHGVISGIVERDGRLDLALEHVLQALSLFQSAGDRWGEAYALNEVGWTYAQLGDYSRALAYCERALEADRAVGDRGYEAATWDSLGYIHHQLESYAEAVDCYRRSLELYESLADQYHTALTSSNLAETQQATGDLAAARSTWTNALRILESLGHRDAERVRSRLRALDQA